MEVLITAGISKVAVSVSLSDKVPLLYNTAVKCRMMWVEIDTSDVHNSSGHPLVPDLLIIHHLSLVNES